MPSFLCTYINEFGYFAQAYLHYSHSSNAFSKMDLLKKIKPLYLYLISGLFLLISNVFKNEHQSIFYLFLTLSVCVFIWAVIKYFKN